MTILQIPRVIDDILALRDFTTKQNRTTVSFVIAFKSNHIRDFVVNTKRVFGILTYPMILGMGEDEDIIYVNEFLPNLLYNLFKAARQRKADLKWDGFIWTKNTKIST